MTSSEKGFGSYSYSSLEVPFNGGNEVDRARASAELRRRCLASINMTQVLI